MRSCTATAAVHCPSEYYSDMPFARAASSRAPAAALRTASAIFCLAAVALLACTAAGRQSRGPALWAAPSALRAPARAHARLTVPMRRPRAVARAHRSAAGSEMDGPDPKPAAVPPAPGHGLDTLDALDAVLEDDAPEEAPAPEEDVPWVAAPLLRRSGFLAIALRFPNASTSGQRERGERGVSLDFLLDTASTVNVLNPLVAQELALPVVGMQPAGTAAAGKLASAPTFLLGDVQLDHLPPAQRFALMTGLQASALAVPTPGCPGLLGRAFMDCFPAVELRFEDNEVRFHGEYDWPAAAAADGLTRVPVQTLGISGLWGLQLRVGDVTLPALVDTGCPVTTFNRAAAAAVGRPVAPAPSPQPKGFFERLIPGLAPPEVGIRVQPLDGRVSAAAEIDGGLLDFGELQPMVGDVPGFQAIGIPEGAPAVVLGLDVLRKRKAVVLSAAEQVLLM